MESQFERLLLNPDVIIATPGRFMHCLQQTGILLSRVEMVVYDECDRLFEMGFAEQLKAITSCMPASRQSLLFSATISEDVKNFTLAGIKDYKLVQVDKDSKLSDQLKIHFFVCRTVEKEAILLLNNMFCSVCTNVIYVVLYCVCVITMIIVLVCNINACGLQHR